MLLLRTKSGFLSGENINIASGGSINGVPVPDGGASLLLLSMGLGLIVAAKQRLVG
jgi:hypothetical protein